MSEKLDEALWDALIDLCEHPLVKGSGHYWMAASDTPMGANLHVFTGRFAGYDRWLARSVGRKDVCPPQETVCDSKAEATEAAHQFMAEIRHYTTEDFRELR